MRGAYRASAQVQPSPQTARLDGVGGWWGTGVYDRDAVLRAYIGIDLEGMMDCNSLSSSSASLTGQSEMSHGTPFK